VPLTPNLICYDCNCRPGIHMRRIDVELQLAELLCLCHIHTSSTGGVQGRTPDLFSVNSSSSWNGECRLDESSAATVLAQRPAGPMAHNSHTSDQSPAPRRESWVFEKCCFSERGSRLPGHREIRNHVRNCITIDFLSASILNASPQTPRASSG